MQNLQQAPFAWALNYRAAFGGHPHQSKIGSEEPIFDSFSLEGEAFWQKTALISIEQTASDHGQGFSPRGDTPGWPLLPFGQFTFSCQPPALRNRGLTDVGHRRRRQRYPFPCCVDLGRNENILDIFRAHRAVWGTPRERCPYEGICNLPQRSTPSVEKSPQIVNFWWICFIRFEIFV